MELVQLPELREATSGTLKVERESARERERETLPFWLKAVSAQSVDPCPDTANPGEG